MKKILFTGGTSGIAYHTILRMIKQNYFIYVTCHTDSEVKRMKKRFYGVDNIDCFRLDLLNDDDIEKVRKLDIDVLICNAAIGEGGNLLEIPISLVKENFDVNVFQNLKLIQFVLPGMIRKEQGKIIIMASLGGILPIPFLGSYCASKASLIQLSEVLRMELKMISKHIFVSVIEPGFYHTGFNQVMLNKNIDWLQKNSSYKEELFKVAMIENKLCRILEKESYDSIVNKIEEAIISNHPKKIYRSPFSQVMVTKIYQLFFK